MGSLTLSVEEYIARQPKYLWRRRLSRWLVRRILFSIIRVEASGLENIPDTGPAILMMNHIAFWDPIICYGAITNRFPISMSKAENMHNPFLRLAIAFYGGYYVQRGEVDRKALASSIELLKSGQMILIAPEGTRHPEGLAPAKDGLAYVATKSDAVIIPAALGGANEVMSQLKRLRRGYVRVHFGRPFRFKTDGRARIPREELSTMMREAMYQLALAIPPGYEHLRGHYHDVENATTDTLSFVDVESLAKTV